MVTAAQAIMSKTLITKKKWRILSLREHSGNRQWEILKVDPIISTLDDDKMKYLPTGLNITQLFFLKSRR